VRELGEEMLRLGHQVLGLAPIRGSAAEPWVLRIGRPIDLTYNASNAPIDPRPWSARAVRRALQRFGPDVVHVHEPFAPSTSLWAMLVARAPIVATFHSGATTSRAYDLAAPVLRWLARRIAVRVAVSRAAARFAERRIGGPFEIVPNGLEVARWWEAEPRKDLGNGTKLLFCGRLDGRKGFPTALDAFARLAADRADVRMIVAGDGPDRDAVQRLAGGARARVTMLGMVPHEELPPIHRACDVYLGTSIGGESFGIVLAEAMAAGLPVVASHIPGYDEVVTDGVDGVLVRARDAAALAAATARVLDDPALAARLAAGGRERAASFDWSVVAAQLVDRYERAARLR
jgi:phosphatidylinositol alpha-mannosyltransferase